MGGVSGRLWQCARAAEQPPADQSDGEAAPVTAQLVRDTGDREMGGRAGVCGRVRDRVRCLQHRREPRCYTHGEHASLWALGVLLAVYDGAEVVLKPAFGALSDRVGPRPVLLGGLLAFAGFLRRVRDRRQPALVGWPASARARRRRPSPRPLESLVARLAPPKRRAVRSAATACSKASATPPPTARGALVTLGGFPSCSPPSGARGHRRIWPPWRCPPRHPLPRARPNRWPTWGRRLRSPGFLTPTAAWPPPPPRSRSGWGSCRCAARPRA